MKENDKVVCLNNYYGENHTTEGNTYIVVASDDEYIQVVNDNRNINWYQKKDFKLESEEVVSISDKPVVSDGLSTSYYQLTITNEAGESIQCEMGDVIRCVVGDNFSLGNVLKAARRMYEASQGRGKADVSMTYDANKIAYFSKEYAKFYEDKP